MVITRRRLSIGVAGGAAAAMIPLAVVYACSALVTVTPPGSGVPGSTITVGVGQVYAGAHVVVYMSGPTTPAVSVYSGTAPGTPSNDTTSMSFSMTVPNWAPGEYYFRVTATGGIPVGTYIGKNAAVFQMLAPSPTSQYNSNNGPTGLRPGTSQVPHATGQATAGATGSALAGSGATAAAPQLSPAIAARVADRDGVAQAFPVSPASSASQSGATVALAPETAGQGNAMLTGLIVGVVTLAVGLPLLLMGFATVTALQRRATRTNSRSDSHSDRERLS